MLEQHVSSRDQGAVLCELTLNQVKPGQNRSGRAFRPQNCT